MSDILPSKKVLILAGALLVVLALIVIIDGIGDDESDASMLSLELSSRDKIDSDEDGLADWEERLWRTDPYNPDTDGDGTLDGDEVKANRHPRVPAPDDEILSDYKSFVYSKENADAQTVSASQELYSKIAPNIAIATGKKISGEPLSDKDYQAIVAPIVEEMEKATALYTAADLSIQKNASTKNKEVYALTLLQTTARYSQQEFNLPDILQTAAKAYTEGDTTLLLSLDANVSFYRTYMKEIQTIRVPEEYLQEHLTLLNSFSGVATSIRQIQKIVDEPLIGLVGLEQYNTYYTAGNQTFYSLGQKLRPLAQASQ